MGRKSRLKKERRLHGGEKARKLILNVPRWYYVAAHEMAVTSLILEVGERESKGIELLREFFECQWEEAQVLRTEGDNEVRSAPALGLRPWLVASSLARALKADGIGHRLPPRLWKMLREGRPEV